MELQRVVWQWDSLVARLGDQDQSLQRLLDHSCRPLEAERHNDGLLVLAIGCWSRPGLLTLNREVERDRLAHLLGPMLEDRLRIVLAPWPGGVLDEAPDAQLVPPDILVGLPDSARQEASRCESPVQRHFYAHAYRRGLRPRCQFVLQRFRLDFAFPERRAAAEVLGWDWDRAREGGTPREREEELGVENWRVRSFSGRQALAQVDRCLDAVERLFEGEQGLMTRRFRSQRSPDSSSQQLPWLRRQPRPPGGPRRPR